MHEAYRRNSDVIFRKIADEFILVPVRQKAVDLRSIYTLNGTGAFIWELIDGKRGVPEIIDKLVSEFDVDAPQAEADVSQIVSQWEALGLIKKV